MAETTKDIVTYPALNGALTKVKNKLQEQINNAAGSGTGKVFSKKIQLTVNTSTNTASISTDLAAGEWTEAYNCDAITFVIKNDTYSQTSECIGQIISRTDNKITVAIQPEFRYVASLKLIIAYLIPGGKGSVYVIDLLHRYGLNVTEGNNTSVKASDGLIELKQGNASLTMQNNAIAADLGSNTTVNAKAGEISLKQGDAMVQLKGEGVLLKQDLSRVQIAGNEIHAVIWEGEAAEVYIRIAPDGIWIRSGLVQEGQMRLLRLDKLLSAGFFDW